MNPSALSTVPSDFSRTLPEAPSARSPKRPPPCRAKSRLWLAVTFLAAVFVIFLCFCALSCSRIAREEEIKAVVDGYLAGMNSGSWDFQRYVHSQASSMRSHERESEYIWRRRFSRIDLRNMEIMERTKAQARVRLTMRMYSRFAPPPDLPPLTEKWDQMWTLRPERGTWKIYSADTVEIRREQGVELPNLDRRTIVAQVCRVLDPSSPPDEVVQRIRKRFGRIAGGQTNANQVEILHAIAMASAASIGLVSADGFNLTSQISRQVPIDYEPTRKSNYTAPFLLTVLDCILPELKPHLCVLIIDEMYLIPVLRKKASLNVLAYGYDLVQPDNLLVSLEPDFSWVKARYRDVTSCTLGTPALTSYLIAKEE